MTTTDVDTGIRRATSDDRTALATTIAAGFFDDPVTRWLLPDVEQRRALVVPTFEIYVGAYPPHGSVPDRRPSRCGGVAAAARHAADRRAGNRVRHRADGAGRLRLPPLPAAGGGFAEYHPEEPLYYCQFLSTVPGFQSQGIGSAFLRDMLARADDEGMPAYHEATSPRNRALYERHGYVDQGAFTLPDGGPTLWRMWQEPR